MGREPISGLSGATHHVDPLVALAEGDVERPRHTSDHRRGRIQRLHARPAHVHRRPTAHPGREARRWSARRKRRAHLRPRAALPARRPGRRQRRRRRGQPGRRRRRPDGGVIRRSAHGRCHHDFDPPRRGNAELRRRHSGQTDVRLQHHGVVVRRHAAISRRTLCSCSAPLSASSSAARRRRAPSGDAFGGGLELQLKELHDAGEFLAVLFVHSHQAAVGGEDRLERELA